MVRGLELFGRFFRPFRDQYILIGGAACDLLHQNAGLDFRATKDLDIVICVDASFVDFPQALRQFIHDGGYEIRERSVGRPVFYRFKDPVDDNYPFQLELFSKKPEGISLSEDAHITPIKVGNDIESLSAILLEDSYYEFLRSGRKELSGISTVGPEFLIPLKARAFLDLRERKDHGDTVDTRDISKHRNDVFRLSRLVNPELHMDLPADLRGDLDQFFAKLQTEDIDPRNFGLRAESRESLLKGIRKIYERGQ